MQNARMYWIYKWFEFFFRALADMMASCAEIGMVATLRAEYSLPDRSGAPELPADDPAAGES